MLDATRGQNVRFWFHALSNKTYSVEYRDSLSVSEWVTLASYASLPTNRVQWATNVQEGGLGKRYYRVKTPLNGAEPLGELKLESVGQGEGQVRFKFKAVAERSYSVEYQAGLGKWAWQTLVSYDAAPVERVIWVTNDLPLGPTNVFYRLKAPRNDRGASEVRGAADQAS